jgi:V/A-type H+-transporting ATPase subunit G/H
MKSEVLKSIKQTEEAYRTMISEARTEREKRISGAKQEADNLIMKAKADIEEYKKKRLADAREEAIRTRKTIIKTGEDRATALRTRGKKNLDKAAALLIERLKEQLHVTA